MTSTAATYQEPGPCPCQHPRCDVIGTKLTRQGYLVGCKSPQAVGKRNKKKGQRGEARAHKLLGGTGPTIRDDLFHLYSINISLEVKTGNQVPAKLVSSVESEFMRSAFGQARKKIPVGTDALPAVLVQPHGGGSYLVVDVGGKTLRA